MRTTIAVMLGWAIGFGGAALFPSTPGPLWVALGSAVALFVHWAFV